MAKVHADTTEASKDVDKTFDLRAEMEIIKKASGLTINFNKTEGMWIGSSGNNKAKPWYLLHL